MEWKQQERAPRERNFGRVIRYQHFQPRLTPELRTKFTIHALIVLAIPYIFHNMG